MSQKTLTFSVAAYNVEQFLHNLCRSLLVPEVLEDIEVLIVNDGSKDGTAAIAKEYEVQYPGVFHLVDKENGGHGSTINKGLTLATGKYFRALDGDDWVDAPSLVQLVDFLKHTDADMIFSDHYECIEGRTPERKETPLPHGLECSFDEIADKFTWFQYHNIIYKTELFRKNAIRPLDEHCFYVDSEFMLFPIPYVQTVACCKVPLYCYRLGLAEQSVSVASKKKHLKDSQTVAASMLDFYTQLPEVSDKKHAYITRAVGRQMNWHMRLLAEFGPWPASKRRLVEFDQSIRSHSEHLYRMTVTLGDESKMVALLRKTHYLAYAPIAAYKDWKRWRGKN